MKRIIIFIISVCLIASALSCSIFAGTSYKQVQIRVKNDSSIKLTGYLVNNTTYVPFRDFYVTLKGADISWNAKTKTASAVYDEVRITAKVNDRCIYINNKGIKTSSVNLLINNRMYIPIRAAAENAGLTVEWNQKTYSVLLTIIDNSESEHTFVKENSINNDDVDNEHKVDENDLYWLSRLIHAEAVGQPFEGKIAVGNVVMNRVRSSDYPNTVYDVIFDKKYGTQFSPTDNGSIYIEPDNESIEAAKKVLEGYSIDDNIIFFVNHDLSTSTWFYTRTFVFKIGDHSFYS